MGFCPGVPYIRRTEAQNKRDNPYITLRLSCLGRLVNRRLYLGGRVRSDVSITFLAKRLSTGVVLEGPHFGVPPLIIIIIHTRSSIARATSCTQRASS